MANDIKKLDEQIASLQRQREEAVAKARSDARSKIEAVLAEAETSLDEIFPEYFSKAGGKKRGAPSKPRQAGTPKYLAEGKEIDGRAARRHPAFEKVLKGGRIDDAKAAAAGLVNPRWVAEQPESVRKAMKLGGQGGRKKRSTGKAA